jgi:hypothetical protein
LLAAAGAAEGSGGGNAFGVIKFEVIPFLRFGWLRSGRDT